MNRGVYSTVSGMVATQKWLDVVANNLANVSTNGFKRDGISFTDALDQQLRAAGGMGPAIGSLSSGTSASNEYTVMDVGPVQPTGRPLDFAINGDHGMFALQTPQGVGYTRDGAFTLDSNRQIVSNDGYPVLDDGGNPITLPQGTVSVDSAGQISVNGTSVAKIGVYDGQFMKEGGNLYSSANASTISTATITPQALEGSNVNPVESMIEMIQIGRAYELAQKSVQQQDSLTQQLTQSLSSH